MHSIGYMFDSTLIFKYQQRKYEYYINRNVQRKYRQPLIIRRRNLQIVQLPAKPSDLYTEFGRCDKSHLSIVTCPIGTCTVCILITMIILFNSI
jgi:hypothetical protein